MTSLGNALSENLYRVGHGAQQDSKQRVVSILSGNTVMGISGMCFSILMLICVSIYEKSENDFYIYSSLYGVFFVGSSFVLFWHLNKQNVQNIYVDMQEVLRQMEKEFTGHGAMGSDYVPTIRKVSKIMWISFIAQVVGLALLPPRESICPPDIRGTWILSAMWVFQCTTFIAVGITGTHIFESQVAFVLYFRGSLALLGDFLQTAEESTIKRLARFHSDLLTVSEKRKRIFSAWNGMIFFYMLFVSVYSTFIIIRGVFIPAIAALLPTMVSCALSICTVGNILENACEKYSQAVNDTKWYSATESHKTVVLQMITRCQRREILHANIFGAISYPLFISFCKNYYRFVQAMLNIKR